MEKQREGKERPQHREEECVGEEKEELQGERGRKARQLI